LIALAVEKVSNPVEASADLLQETGRRRVGATRSANLVRNEVLMTSGGIVNVRDAKTPLGHLLRPVGTGERLILQIVWAA
jgi:hypothetical protein